jgi:AcrR family transcriptional regulator
MAQEKNQEARDRIVNAAVTLFSKKGYDGTRVSEIADMAGVNKALIYYYFKSKEEILDQMLQAFYENVKLFFMDFIEKHIVQMIKDGRLDIEVERFHFTTEEDVKDFLQSVRSHYSHIVTYLLENRQIIRILLLESLKNSKHRTKIFNVYRFLRKSDDNPLFKTIYDADHDFDYSDEILDSKFFFAIMPLLNFAAYYDDWKEVRGLNDAEMQASFISALDMLVSFFVSGQDIIVKR